MQRGGFIELLPRPDGERAQILIIGSREQVQHNINDFYIKRVITDRSQFSPVLPAPFATGKWMAILLR